MCVVAVDSAAEVEELSSYLQQNLLHDSMMAYVYSDLHAEAPTLLPPQTSDHDHGLGMIFATVVVHTLYQSNARVVGVKQATSILTGALHVPRFSHTNTQVN